MQKICSYCGNKMDDGEEVCSKCGKSKNWNYKSSKVKKDDIEDDE